VENSPQVPTKQTAEANYSANSVREHSDGKLTSSASQTDRRSELFNQLRQRTFRGTLQALQKPTAETVDSKKTGRIPSHTTDPPSTRTRRSGSRKMARKQDSWCSSETQLTKGCCHRSINHIRWRVVPQTTRHEPQTSAITEVVEDAFDPHPRVEGTDRRSETIRNST